MPDPKKMDTMREREDYSKALNQYYEAQVEALTLRLIDEEITLDEWHSQMKALIRESHVQHFITGKGGDKTTILEGDYGQLGTPAREQYRYLKDFAQAIYDKNQAGKDINFAINRSKLYMRTCQASFWRGAVPVSLPQVPKDGGTKCRSNCKCHLDIKYEKDENGKDIAVLVFWELASAEHCSDCITLNREWNPLRLPITKSASSWKQAIMLYLTRNPKIGKEELKLLLALRGNDHEQ